MDDWWIYADESGDLGFGPESSRYITIAALCTEEDKEVARIPHRVRRRKLRKKLMMKPELKFHNSSPEIRKEVLRRLAGIDGLTLGCLIVNKGKVKPELKERKDKLYHYFCGELIAGIAGSNRVRKSFKSRSTQGPAIERLAMILTVTLSGEWRRHTRILDGPCRSSGYPDSAQRTVRVFKLQIMSLGQSRDTMNSEILRTMT